ncbi:hypothetical protein ACVW2L_001736 [Mucilaginibacter sp. HD30]
MVLFQKACLPSMRMTGASALFRFHCLTWYCWGKRCPLRIFLKAAAINDKFVLDDEGMIGDGVGAFGVMDIHRAVGLAGGKE